MVEDCPECQMWRESGANFCRNCGRQLNVPAPPMKEKSLFAQVIAKPLVALCVLVIVFDLVYCLANFGSISDELRIRKVSVSVSYFLDEVTLFHIGGEALVVYFILILSVIIICLGLMIYGLVPRAKEEHGTGDSEPVLKSCMVGCTTIMAACMFLSVVYLMFVTASGNPPDSSWTDAYSEQLMAFLLNRAGVREELMFRMFWIGIPMAVLVLTVRRDRRCWQYLFGGFGMSRATLILILLSSIAFGMAHLEGWGWSKVPDAVLGGLFFGYIYVQYGLHAAIIAHALNDVILVAGYVFPFLSGLGFLLILGAGLIVIVYWIMYPNRGLFDLKNMQDYPDEMDCGLLEQLTRH